MVSDRSVSDMVWLNAESGLSGWTPGIGLCDSDTVRPRVGRARACRRFSSVIRLAVPSSSSGPQRPQFLTSSNSASNSASSCGPGPSCPAAGPAARAASTVTAANQPPLLLLRIICFASWP